MASHATLFGPSPGERMLEDKVDSFAPTEFVRPAQGHRGVEREALNMASSPGFPALNRLAAWSSSGGEGD